MGNQQTVFLEMKQVNFEQMLGYAKAGEKQALEELFEMYRPVLRKNSYINGIFDEELWAEQCFHFVLAVRKFEL